MTIRRRFIFVPLLIVIIIANLYQDEQSQVERLQVPVDTNELPDYYMEQLSIKLFDDNGLLQAAIDSPTLIHYASQAQAEMERPEITLFAVNDQVWNLTAAKGRILDESQDIALDEDVLIQLEKPGTNLVTFETDNLYYEFLAHRAWNESKVTFNRTDARGSANGLLIDLNTETFELQNQVEVRHQH